MASSDLSGKVQTVLGPIDPDQLGVTHTHEHLLFGAARHHTAWDMVPTEASVRQLYHEKVSMENVGYMRHHGARNADNSTLSDVETAIEEVLLYKQYGGQSLVDASSITIGRDPVGLARISRAAGVNVIMGGSYYVASSHPPDMDSRTEDDLTAQIARDVLEGVDATRIRSGVIGEVGCTWPLTDNERKVLRASARAQRLTGAPLLIHPGLNEESPMVILEVLEDAGADLSRTIMGHIDQTVFLRSTLKQIAETGCYLEWDLFGWERPYYEAERELELPTSATRMADIAWISSEGYGDRIVIAQDICTKHRLLRYGGHGYFFILAQIVPRMRKAGYAEEAIDKILVDNPAAALTFTEPMPA